MMFGIMLFSSDNYIFHVGVGSVLLEKDQMGIKVVLLRLCVLCEIVETIVSSIAN